MAPRLAGPLRALLVGALMLAAVAALLHTPALRSLARQRLVAWLATRGIVATIGAMDYNLPRLQATFRAVRLAGSRTLERPFFAADVVEVDVPAAILGGGLRIDSLTIRRGTLHIARDARGRWNLPETPTAGPDAFDALPIGRLHVDHLRIAIEDLVTAFKLEVPDLSASLGPAGAGVSAGLVAAAGPTRVDAGDRRIVVGDLSARVRYDGRAVALESLRTVVFPGVVPGAPAHDASVRTPPVLSASSEPAGEWIALRASGRIGSVFSGPVFDIAAQGTARLEPVPAFVGVPTTLSGSIRWEAALSGPPSGLRVAGSATGQELGVGRLHGVEITATTTLSPDGASVDRLALRGAGGRLDASGRASFADGTGDGELRATWRDLRLPDLLAASGAPEAVRIDSAISGEIIGRWPRWEWDTLQVTATNVARSTGRGVGAPLSGRLDLTSDQGRWRLRHEHQLGQAGTLSGTLGGVVAPRVHDWTASGRTTLVTGDIGALAALAAKAGVEGVAALEARVGGPARLDAQIEGRLGDPRVSMTLEGDDLRSGRVAGVSALARAVYDDGRLHLSEAEVRIADDALRGEGVVDLERRTVQGRLTADLRNLPLVMAAAAGPPSLAPTGAVTVRATVVGSLSAPRVDGHIEGADLSVAGQRFDRLRAEVQAQGSTVSIPRLRLEQDEGALEASGAIDLVSRRYRMSLAGSSISLGRIPPGVVSDSAVPMEGTIERIDVEGEGRASRAVGRASIRLARVRIANHDTGTWTANATLDGRNAEFTGAAEALGGSFDGLVALEAPWRYSLRARLSTDDLKRFTPPGRLHDFIAGSAALEAQAVGTLSPLEAARASLDVLSLEGRLGATPLRLASPGQITYGSNRLEVTGLGLFVGRTLLRASGSLGGPSERLSLDLRGGLDDVPPLLEVAGATERIQATGSLSAHVEATGSLPEVRVSGDVSIQSAAVTVGGLPPFLVPSLRVEYRDGQALLRQSEVRWQGARLAADGRAPARLLGRWLPPRWLAAQPAIEGPAQLTVRFEALTPSLLSPFVAAGTLEPIEGRLDGELALEADALELERITGKMTLTTASLKLAQVPLAQVRPTRAELGDGRLRITDWEWAGAGNRFLVGGGLALAAPGGPRFDAAVDGTIDLRMAGAVTREVATGGTLEVSISIGGPVREPRIDGRVEMRGGEVRVRDPRIAVSDLSGTAVLTHDTIRIDRFVGSMNGGDLEGGGEVSFPGLEVSRLSLWGWASGVALDYPSGLRTEISTAMLVRQEGVAATPEVSGQVSVERGAYRAPLSLLALARQLASSSTPAGDGLRTESRLGDTRLDIEISTQSDVVFDNNYAQFEAGAGVRLVGTLAQPGLSGRIDLREGGELFLAGNTYRIQSGTIDFANATRIEPELGIVARTRAGGEDISLAIRGKPDAIQIDLTSDSAPELSSGDLASLLLTGRTLDRASADQAAVAGEQLAGLLSGEILSFAGRAVGLDSVRIERGSTTDELRYDPTLVASETDPSGRLTISKRLGGDVELIFSQSLRDPGRLTWILSYAPSRLVEVRAISRDNEERILEFRQELVFGGTAGSAPERAARSEAPRVSAVRINGGAEADAARLKSRLKLSEGDRFDFFRWQDDRDRLLEQLHERGRFEARVGTSRREVGGESGDPPTVALTYDVDPGPQTEIDVRGVELPRETRREIEQLWTRSVFDGFLVDDVGRTVRIALVRQGDLLADVHVSMEGSGGTGPKRLLVRATPGPPTDRRLLVFTGNEAMDDERLEQALLEAGLRDSLWVEPAAIVAPLGREYERAGYLEARVEVGEVSIEGGMGKLPVFIHEGRPFTLAGVRLEGASALDEAGLLRVAGLDAGTAYEPPKVEQARRRMETEYRRAGFNEVKVVARADVDRAAATVTLRWNVEEGPRQILQSVNVSGADRTHPGVVARALDLEPGRPVNLEEWYRARKRLYDAGVFRQADVRAEPTGRPAANAAGIVEQPVVAQVRLQEWQPYRFRYGVEISDETAGIDTRAWSPGVTGELRVRNLFGRAMTAGVSGRYQSDFREARTFIGAPRFLRLPLGTNLYASRSRERSNAEGLLPFITTRSIIGAEQRYRAKSTFELLYSYRYERNRTRAETIDPDDPFPLDLAVNVGRLASQVLWDTRDDLLDSRRGWFHSSGVEYASEKLGSDLRFVKYLVQQFYYQPVGVVVLASAARVGLGDGFGQDLIPAERFFAGGGNTVRGYPQDSLGPRTFFGDPLGGEALIVLNQEARFPIYRWLRGVGFVDAGNVFLEPSDMSLGDLEVGAGVGLRLATPFGLFRVDLGYPVSATDGRRVGRWYFSIGQAF